MLVTMVGYLRINGRNLRLAVAKRNKPAFFAPFGAAEVLEMAKLVSLFRDSGRRR